MYLYVSSFSFSVVVLQRISGRGRPITLAFRQLHAAIDGRREARRYWQGYLRLKTGDIEDSESREQPVTIHESPLAGQTLVADWNGSHSLTLM